MVCSSWAALSLGFISISANAAKFTYCCATSPTATQCSFGQGQAWETNVRECFGIAWLGDDAWDEYEFVTSMALFKNGTGTASTSKGNTFYFGVTIPEQWKQSGWQLDGDGSPLKAHVGRHVVGLTLASQKPFLSVTDVVTEPMPIEPMQCDDGVHIVCPLDPMFSEIEYKVKMIEDETRVKGADENEDCVSEGSWDTLRTSFRFKMDACPMIEMIGKNNVSLKKKAILEPVLGVWYDHIHGHPSIPAEVECTCVFEASKEMAVRISDDGYTAAILRMQAEGKNGTKLTVARSVISQDDTLIVLNASTTLDHIQIQWCNVDAIHKGHKLALNLPLVHETQPAHTFTSSDLGIADSDIGTLKRRNIQIQYPNEMEKDLPQYQLVSLKGITTGKDYLLFTCFIEVCLDRDLTRCSARRLDASFDGGFLQDITGGGRLLQENSDDELQEVVLSDSQCLGEVHPGFDTDCSNTTDETGAPKTTTIGSSAEATTGTPPRLREGNSNNETDAAIHIHVAGMPTMALMVFISLM